jgi:hypothetical protein
MRQSDLLSLQADDARKAERASDRACLLEQLQTIDQQIRAHETDLEDGLLRERQRHEETVLHMTMRTNTFLAELHRQKDGIQQHLKIIDGVPYTPHSMSSEEAARLLQDSGVALADSDPLAPSLQALTARCDHIGRSSARGRKISQE